MGNIDELTLNNFIVTAKGHTYVAKGQQSLAYRPGAHDLQFHDGAFAYLDSYFGGTDFIGQEVVYYEGKPVWAMNYYGRILLPSHLNAAQAGQIIMESLSALYRNGRFLGGYEHETSLGKYTDTNQGDVFSFQGIEWIEVKNKKAYELLYHGGLIKE